MRADGVHCEAVAGAQLLARVSSNDAALGHEARLTLVRAAHGKARLLRTRLGRIQWHIHAFRQVVQFMKERREMRTRGGARPTVAQKATLDVDARASSRPRRVPQAFCAARRKTRALTPAFCHSGA